MQRRGFWVLLARAASVLSLLPACSDDSVEATTVVCNDLVNDGPEVRYVALSDPAPTPAGGTILEGIYELTAINLYGVSEPAPDSIVRAVFQIEGTTIEQAGELDGMKRTYTSTFSAEETRLTIEDTCPNPSHDEPEFSATSTDLRFFLASGEETVEMVLRKR